MVLRIRGAMAKLHYAYKGVDEAMSSPDLTTYQRDRLAKAQEIINDVLIRLEDQTGMVYDPQRKRRKVRRR